MVDSRLHEATRISDIGENSSENESPQLLGVFRFYHSAVHPDSAFTNQSFFSGGYLDITCKTNIVCLGKLSASQSLVL